MPQKTKRDARKPLLLATLALVLLFAALPTATVLALGMAPTLAAMVVDVTPGRYLMKCVAGMNFAGVVPFLHRLWSTGHDLHVALDIVTDIFVVFVMYASAGLGWLLFFGFPSAVATCRSLNAKRRIYFLREKQKNLLEEWGECILPPGTAAESLKPDASSAEDDAAEGQRDAVAPAAGT